MTLQADIVIVEQPRDESPPRHHSEVQRLLFEVRIPAAALECGSLRNNQGGELFSSLLKLLVLPNVWLVHLELGPFIIRDTGLRENWSSIRLIEAGRG